jgi:hypothetical protein
VAEEAVLVQFGKPLHESIHHGYFSWCVTILLDWRLEIQDTVFFFFLRLISNSDLYFVVLGFCGIDNS